MSRNILGLMIVAMVAAGGLALAYHHEDGESVKVISAWDIPEKLDGKAAKATVVEVTIEAGQAGVPHRHPGTAIVYVLEGEYELGINDKPTKIYKAGESFCEPAGSLHRVSKNPSAKGRTRLIAVVLHPREEKEIAVPEKKHE